MNKRWAAFLLYDLLLVVVGVLLSPFAIFRALRSPDFRRSLPGRLGFAKDLAVRPGRILLHGVSVGEVKALKPLVAELSKQYPDRELVISSTTPTGISTAKQLFPNFVVTAYPLDLPGVCRRFLRRIQPDLVVLAELEIWPNFLATCNALHIQVAIVNGRITQRSLAGYRRVQKWLPQFERIALYGVQNQRYANRFSELDVPSERVVVCGNLKYDNLPTAAEQEAFAGSIWRHGLGGVPIVVLASTHEPEEVDLVREWIGREGSTHAVLVVVPRHPQRCEALIPRLQRLAPHLNSRLFSQAHGLQDLRAGSLLLVDAFGQLEFLYRVAQMAFVGGSLVDHGGQNVLEPAVFGVPVVVGPHTENFEEEVEVLAAEGGVVRAQTAQEVVECLLEWLQDSDSAQKIGQNGANALESKRGAAQSTVLALHQAGLL